MGQKIYKPRITMALGRCYKLNYNSEKKPLTLCTRQTLFWELNCTTTVKNIEDCYPICYILATVYSSYTPNSKFRRVKVVQGSVFKRKYLGSVIHT